MSPQGYIIYRCSLAGHEILHRVEVANHDRSRVGRRAARCVLVGNHHEQVYVKPALLLRQQYGPATTSKHKQHQEEQEEEGILLGEFRRHGHYRCSSACRHEAVESGPRSVDLISVTGAHREHCFARRCYSVNPWNRRLLQLRMCQTNAQRLKLHQQLSPGEGALRMRENLALTGQLVSPNPSTAAN